MKKMKFRYVLILLMISTGITFSQYQVTGSVFGSGGSTTANTNYILNSTVSESFIGKSSNVDNQQFSGFWYVYQKQIITSVENHKTIPGTFKLEQNYPNPFNPTTVVKFAIPEKSHVVIKIYDITGSTVATIINEELDAGWYEYEFNAGMISSGVYFYRMETSNYVNIKKMLLLK